MHADISLGGVWIPNPTEQGLKLGGVGAVNSDMARSESLIQQSKDWNWRSEVFEHLKVHRLNP